MLCVCSRTSILDATAYTSRYNFGAPAGITQGRKIKALLFFSFRLASAMLAFFDRVKGSIASSSFVNFFESEIVDIRKVAPHYCWEWHGKIF